MIFSTSSRSGAASMTSSNDGSKLTEGETAEFKVIEFSKEFKRVVVSHMQTHDDSSPEEIVEEKVKEKKSDKKDEE